MFGLVRCVWCWLVWFELVRLGLFCCGVAIGCGLLRLFAWFVCVRVVVVAVHCPFVGWCVVVWFVCAVALLVVCEVWRWCCLCVVC